MYQHQSIRLDYQEHIRLLCERYRINVGIINEPLDSFAHTRSRVIGVPIPNNALNYAIALHEIGHLVAPMFGSRIDCEIIAWNWAQDNALEWNKDMERIKQTGLNSYLKHIHDI